MPTRQSMRCSCLVRRSIWISSVVSWTTSPASTTAQKNALIAAQSVSATGNGMAADVRINTAMITGNKPSRACLRAMIRARSGVILNVGSFASERVIEAPVHYAAAKAAVRGLTEAMAREVGRYGIRVNLIAPGMLDVGMTLALPRHRVDEYLSQCPAGRLGHADEIAAFAVFLASDAARFVTGAKIAVDGGV